MRTQTVTVVQMRTILSAIRGAQPVTFTALTKPEGHKAPWVIHKLVRVNAMTGCRYVNAAAKAGVDTVAEERAWGEHNESAVVTRAAKDGTEVAYLPVQLNHVSRPFYLIPIEGHTGRSRFRAVTSNTVQPYLRPERPMAVPYKDYRLDHVISLAIAGRRYRVRAE